MDWNELQSLTWPGYARKNGGKRSESTRLNSSHP